jgi:hypothetical protein
MLGLLLDYRGIRSAITVHVTDPSFPTGQPIAHDGGDTAQ